MIAPRHALVAVLALAPLLTQLACSQFNRDGIETTCEALECGRYNVCHDGIISHCADGKEVRYEVCGSRQACDQAWQTPGEYRCGYAATDCLGCRPYRVDGCESEELLEGLANEEALGGGDAVSD